MTNKVGDIRLRAGDTLLLQTGTQFTKAFRNKPDFYLVSDVEDSRPVRFNRSLARRNHFRRHDHGVRERTR